MLRSLIKRLLLLLLILLGAVMVIHTLIYLIPGDPAQVIAGEYANPDDVAKIRQELSLDDSFLVRYAAYVRRLAVLDMGASIYTGAPVAGIIWERLPATLVLAGVSMLLAGLLGILLGVLSARFKGRWPDDLVLWVSSAFISTPVFVACIVLSLVFSYYLNLLPPSGRHGWNPAYIVLPSLALASRSLALIIRVVRNELIEVMGRDYIRVARSLGFPEARIWLVFALKNVIVPVMAIILLDFGTYLGGAVVTESIFSWPGIGRLMITALFKRDIPVIQGVILFGTLLFILIGLVMDLFQNAMLRKRE